MNIESFQPAFDYINEFLHQLDGSVNCYPDKIVLSYNKKIGNIGFKLNMIEGKTLEEVIEKYYEVNK